MTPKLHKVTKGDKIGKDVPFYNHMLRLRCVARVQKQESLPLLLLAGAHGLGARIKNESSVNKRSRRWGQFLKNRLTLVATHGLSLEFAGPDGDAGRLVVE